MNTSSNTDSALACVLNAAEGRLDIILYQEQPAAHPLIVCAQSWHAPTKGAELLTPALQALCSLQKIQPHAIQRFACVHGPGSFTGIRLTMGTVAAIRRITGASNAGIDYMQALALTAALQVQNIWPDRPLAFCVLTHAKRNLVHCQYFTHEPQQIPQECQQAFLCPPMEIFAAKPTQVSSETPLFVLGSGYLRHEQNIKELCPSQPFLYTLQLEQPSPLALCLLANKASYHQHDLEPLYVRPCDAVENLSHIAQKQGMDPEKAHARLQEILHTEPRL